jgi:hypothetical protein
MKVDWNAPLYFVGAPAGYKYTETTTAISRDSRLASNTHGCWRSDRQISDSLPFCGPDLMIHDARGPVAGPGAIGAV